jgi:hypothetical protein
MLPQPYRVSHLYDEEDSDQDVLNWLFQASLLTSALPEKGMGAPSFTRATPKTFVDYEGRVRTAISGEVCFTGARRVQNYLNATEAMSGGNWASSFGGAGSAATCTGGFLAPDGTSTAFRVQANRSASNTASDISTWVNPSGSAPIGTSVNSVWIKSNTGANQNVLLSLAAANAGDLVVATPTWQRVANVPKNYGIVTANSFAIGTRGTLGSDQVIDVLVWHPQAELVTGNSNQNPSEYVPVGAPKRNEMLGTEDLANTLYWIRQDIGAPVAALARDGTLRAFKVPEDAVATVPHGIRQTTMVMSSIGETKRFGFEAKAAERSVAMAWAFSASIVANTASTVFDLAAGVATGQGSPSMTDLGGGWWLCEWTETAVAAGTFTVHIGPAPDTSGLQNYSGVVGSGIYVAFPRCNTGATLNPYFPVGNAYSYPVVMRDGSLSACFADGVAYARYLNGNTVASNVVTEATGAPIGLWKNASAYQPGITGSGFSTPSSVASNVAGDIDVRIDAALTSWANGSAQYLASKDDTGTQRSWNWFLDGGGVPNFFVSFDGTVGNSATYVATAAPGFGAGTRHSLRVTRSATTGNVTFYKSDDGQSWTQLGAVVAGTSGNIFASLSQTDVGARAASVLSGPLLGTIYRAQVYSGINGTLAVDFNPNDYTSGATWASSTTGETWTKNGGASILNCPLLGYDQWQASTNLAFPSTDWNTSLGAGYTRTPDFAAAPDGSTSAMRLQWAGSANSFCYANVITATVAQVYTSSLYVKANSGTPKVAVRLGANDGSSGVTAEFDFATCTIGAPVATSGTNVVSSTASKATPLANGWWRIQVSGANSTAITNLTSGVIAATNAAGDALVWGLMMEANNFVTPYIATTTAGVSRNTDILTDPCEGNILNAAGSTYAEFSALNNAAGNTRLIGMSTAETPLSFTGTTTATIYDGTTAQQSGVDATMLNGITHKAASRWGNSVMAAALSGVVGAQAAYDGIILGAGVSFAIGSQVGGAGAVNGSIRNVRISGKALPDSVLQSLTA